VTRTSLPSRSAVTAPVAGMSPTAINGSLISRPFPLLSVLTAFDHQLDHRTDRS
jgi:hypothetical protein